MTQQFALTLARATPVRYVEDLKEMSLQHTGRRQKKCPHRRKYVRRSRLRRLEHAQPPGFDSVVCRANRCCVVEDCIPTASSPENIGFHSSVLRLPRAHGRINRGPRSGEGPTPRGYLLHSPSTIAQRHRDPLSIISFLPPPSKFQPNILGPCARRAFQRSYPHSSTSSHHNYKF